MPVPVVVTLAQPVMLALQEQEQEQHRLARSAPKGRENEFTRNRAAEDALLLEYETSGMARAQFAVQKNMRLGTMDGMFVECLLAQGSVAV